MVNRHENIIEVNIVLLFPSIEGSKIPSVAIIHATCFGCQRRMEALRLFVQFNLVMGLTCLVIGKNMG